MPSLPELEVYKHQLSPEIIGRPITRIEPVDFRVVRADTEALEHLLIKATITSIDRYGKWFILDTGAPEQFIVHLGLTGKLHLLTPDDELPRYTAFVIHFSDGRRLVLSDQRHLGKVYVRRFDDLKAEKSLGPDLLDTKPDYFTTTLARKKRGVRDVLMDQKVVAGIGGKYADEVLWQAKLHPNTKLDSLTDAQRRLLFELTRSITDTAIALDANVDRFPADWLIPHRRTDHICPRCHSPLTGRSLGGSATIYCPHCQPPPNPYRRG